MFFFYFPEQFYNINFSHYFYCVSTQACEVYHKTLMFTSNRVCIFGINMTCLFYILKKSPSLFSNYSRLTESIKFSIWKFNYIAHKWNFRTKQWETNLKWWNIQMSASKVPLKTRADSCKVLKSSNLHIPKSIWLKRLNYPSLEIWNPLSWRRSGLEIF